jgi:hypothetical protein
MTIFIQKEIFRPDVALEVLSIEVELIVGKLFQAEIDARVNVSTKPL